MMSYQSEVSKKLYAGSCIDDIKEEDVERDDTIEKAVPRMPEIVIDKRENEDTYVPPSEERLKLLVAQAEFYFADENVLKDAFLLKHIRKDREGYVSIKLISSFRRLQRISKNWRDVAYAISVLSEKLKLNEKKTKVKRITPVPVWDNSADRIVIAVNFQSVCDDITVDNAKQHFKKYGELTLVRIFNPNKRVPYDLHSFVRHHPELTSHVCVLMEFRSLDGAQRALKEFSSETDWQGLQVLPFKKSQIPCITTTIASSDEESSSKDVPSRRFAKGNWIRTDTGGDSSSSEASSPYFGRRAYKACGRTSMSLPIPVPGRLSSWNSGTPGTSPDCRSRNLGCSPLSSSPGSLSTSPWARRRSESNSPQLEKNLITILRQPYGPDGSRGFPGGNPL